jgi:hypothetical protein
MRRLRRECPKPDVVVCKQRNDFIVHVTATVVTEQYPWIRPELQRLSGGCEIRENDLCQMSVDDRTCHIGILIRADEEVLSVSPSFFPNDGIDGLPMNLEQWHQDILTIEIVLMQLILFYSRVTVYSILRACFCGPFWKLTRKRNFEDFPLKMRVGSLWNSTIGRN